MEMFSGQYDDLRLFNIDAKPWMAEWNEKDATYGATQVSIRRITISHHNIIYSCRADGHDVGLDGFEAYAEDLFPTREEALSWAMYKLQYDLDSAVAAAQTVLDAVKEKIANIKEK